MAAGEGGEQAGVLLGCRGPPCRQGARRGPHRTARAPGRAGRERPHDPGNRAGGGGARRRARPARLRRPGPGRRTAAPGVGGRHLEQSARDRPARPRRAEPPRVRRAHLPRARARLRPHRRRHRGDARPRQRMGGRPRGRDHHERGGGAALAAIPALRDRLHGPLGLEPHQSGDRARAAKLGRLCPARARSRCCP